MEQGFDKEIDSLLRRGRGGAASRVGADAAGSPPPQTHLDADELSAFAEGALPSAARFAAAAHLADCDDCRGAVVVLTRAAGVEAALERSPATDPSVSHESRTAASSWRERLGALFAPRVLRFVAPVLAVCLVGALAFVALRQRQGAPELAREGQRENTTRVSITAPGDAGKVEPPSDPNTTTGPAPAANQSAATRGAAPAGGVVAPADGPDEGKKSASLAGSAPAEAPPPPPSVTVHPLQSAGGGGVGAGPAPAPAPKTEPAEEDRSSRSGSNATGQLKEEVNVVGNTQAQSRASQTNVFDVQSPDGGSRAQRRAASPRAGAPASDEVERVEERSDSANERARSAKSRRSRVGEAMQAERETRGETSSAEERSVAGRRFRREGGAWVDVNYKSSMSSTGVRRGTDPYRALVADHPEVERAAQQLSGEFIIVIRGRAYRVRP